MSYLKNIALPSTDNLGGIISLQVARAADVLNIPEPVDGVVYGNIDFFPGKGFVTWSVTGESISTDSTSKISREGASKGNRIPFRVPKDRADLYAMFQQAEEDEFIVLVTDANGKQKLFGLKYAPVRFKFDQTSGAAHADLNHYSCSFYYDGVDNRFEYNGAVASAPAGPAPVVLRWADGTLIALGYPGDEIIVDSDFDHDFQLIQG